MKSSSHARHNSDRDLARGSRSGPSRHSREHSRGVNDLLPRGAKRFGVQQHAAPDGVGLVIAIMDENEGGFGCAGSGRP